MNTVRSSLVGWGAFSTAVLGGLYAANIWRQEREEEHVSVHLSAQLIVPLAVFTPFAMLNRSSKEARALE